MDITPLISADKKVITGYGNKGFVINNIRIEGSIFITSDKIIPQDLIDIKCARIENFLELNNVEEGILLLIGCGHEHQTIDQDLYIEIMRRYKNLKIETMLTSAACRTYNVLLAEGRNIGALLIAV